MKTKFGLDLAAARGSALISRAAPKSSKSGEPAVGRVSNWEHGRSLPISEPVLQNYLKGLGVRELTRADLIADWRTIRRLEKELRGISPAPGRGGARLPGTVPAVWAQPQGAVRVRDARPRLLGVHASIQIKGADGEMPPYVLRDMDGDLHAAITAATDHGGLILLVGGSSVGKTRTLWEAVTALLPEWWLIHPHDAHTIVEFATTPTAHTVVWLDELQRYLQAPPPGVPATVVRDLIAAGTVLVGTLWPGEYNSRVALRTPGQPDPYANDRELLGLAHIITVDDTLTAGEQRRAETLAGTDQRIRIALDVRDAGLMQVLAAGPELIRWWENADQCYGKAVITAALDARRVGVTAPLSRDLLKAAAPGYLTPTQQATASADWLDQALAYATTLLHGAASTLAAVPAGMGRTAGYTAADYLDQHARRIRRTVDLPDVVWQALVDHHHPTDAGRLGDNAAHRGRPNFAIALYCRLADTGDGMAANLAADLLVEQGRTTEATAVLRSVADRSQSAAQRLAHLLAEQGSIDELRQRAATDWSGNSSRKLLELLAGQGRTDEVIEILRRSAAAGDDFATIQLAEVLVQHGHTDEGFEMLRKLADASDRNNVSLQAGDQLRALLAQQGRTDELRMRADAGDAFAARALADVLVEQGHTDEAIEMLLRWTDHDDDEFTGIDGLLADLYVAQGRIEELQERANTGDEFAADWLASLLAEQGRAHEPTDPR